jgi:hypothetical protein
MITLAIVLALQSVSSVGQTGGITTGSVGSVVQICTRDGCNQGNPILRPNCLIEIGAMKMRRGLLWWTTKDPRMRKLYLRTCALEQTVNDRNR